MVYFGSYVEQVALLNPKALSVQLGHWCEFAMSRNHLSANAVMALHVKRRNFAIRLDPYFEAGTISAIVNNSVEGPVEKAPDVVV